MDAKTAQSVFGGPPVVKKRTSKEDNPISYKSTNESLVRKILSYKQQLSQCSKTIEKLRDENLALRQRNQELVDATDDRKIEILVEQRVQSRLAHAAVLNNKLVQILQQTGSEMEGLFRDVQPKQTALNNRRMPKADINLGRVDESPFCTLSREDADESENLMLDNYGSSSSTSSAQNLENGTPVKRNTNGRGRRSELFQFNFDDTITEEKVPAARRAPMHIAPAATPVAAPPAKKAPVSSARRRKSADKFKKPSTPTPISQPDNSEVTDTVRRQRSAKLNIKSFKEPSLNQKLRRPGKHDEPMPYIDTFF